MSDPIQLLAMLYHRPGERRAFRAFETKALALMRDHGGHLVSAFVPQLVDLVETPQEVHLLEFPSRTALDAWKADPRRQELAPERDRVVVRTLVMESREPVDYPDTSAG